MNNRPSEAGTSPTPLRKEPSVVILPEGFEAGRSSRPASRGLWRIRHWIIARIVGKTPVIMNVKIGIVRSDYLLELDNIDGLLMKRVSWGVTDKYSFRVTGISDETLDRG